MSAVMGKGVRMKWPGFFVHVNQLSGRISEVVQPDPIFDSTFNAGVKWRQSRLERMVSPCRQLDRPKEISWNLLQPDKAQGLLGWIVLYEGIFLRKERIPAMVLLGA